MILATPDAPFRRLAGMALSCGLSARRVRNPYARRDWLRVSQRLASGMTPKEVAAAEATDEAAIEDLLAKEEFRGLVASYKALAERPIAEQTARLVALARQAIENALAVDGDMGAAFFVLREHSLGRDPAETIAKGVIASARRRAKGTVAAAPAPAALSRPSRPAVDPGLRLINRGAARLRRALVEEHAARAASSAAPPAATTAEAARKALALRSAAGNAAQPSSAGIRHAARLLASTTLAAAPAAAPGIAPTPPAIFPRRPRAP